VFSDVMIFKLSEYLSVKGFHHLMLIWRYSRVFHDVSSLRNRYNLPSDHHKKFPSIAKLENVPKFNPEPAIE
jgi:hypothetical protein